MSSPLTFPNTFVANQLAQSAQVNANFSQLQTFATPNSVVIGNSGGNLDTISGGVQGQVVGWTQGAPSWLTLHKGSKNYITYTDFENNATTGWSMGNVPSLTNNLPSSTSPTFGSGSTSGTLSIVSSGQLGGSYSLSLAFASASTAGDFLASNAYTIDAEDQAKILGFKFYYSAASGASNGNFSGTSSNSFGVAIWDVANSAWIIPAGVFNLTQSSGIGYCQGTFQTPSNMTSFRLVIYNANATAGALTLYLDDVFVGPQAIAFGPAMSDWKSFTPTGSLTTNTTYSGYYRRVGDSVEILAKLAFSGVNTQGAVTVNLPSGMTIDTTKLVASVNTSDVHLGTCEVYDYSGAVTGIHPGLVNYNSTTMVSVSALKKTSTGSSGDLEYVNVNTSTNLPITISSSCNITLRFIVPVVGWSSNAIQSADTDTRVIAGTYALSGNVSISTATSTTVVWNTALKDTSASMNLSTGVYTVPVSGFYVIQGNLAFSENSTGSRYVSVTGFSQVASVQAATSDYTQLPFTAAAYHNAGDTIYVQGNQTSGGNLNLLGGSNNACQLTIFRLSGPAVVQATESVNASYVGASTTLTNNSTVTIVYTGKNCDSHNAYNTSTGVYMIPVSGKYQITGNIGYAAFAPSAIGDQYGLIIEQNSTQVLHNDQFVQSTTSSPRSANITGIITCSAGDTIQMLQFHNMGATPTISSTAANSFFTISRVGN